jgi:hypothetical protein
MSSEGKQPPFSPTLAYFRTVQSRSMDQQAHKFQLIGNRFSAVFAVCLTGFLASRDFRAMFSAAPHEAGWLMPLDFLPLPIWTVAILNIAFYVYLFWVAFWFYRGVQGKERMIVAGFFTSGLLGLLGRIKAMSSPHAVSAIRAVQTVGMGVAFFAALVILLESPAFGKSDAKTAMRIFLFVGAFFVIALLLGALLYFAPWR